MTPEQKWQWRIALELRLRRLHGDALQEFFSEVMERRHKSDFVRVRPYGGVGDKGCDGYLQSGGQLYQCYGKVDDAALNVKTTTTKMTDDFAKASIHFKDIMKEWHFVNNLLDGLPSDVILTIEKLRTENPGCKFHLVGLEWFADAIFGLPETDIVHFLGPAATAEQTHGLDLEIVRELLAAMTKDIPAAPIDEGDPRPVPVDKLEYNEIAGHWAYFLRTGTANAKHVQQYCDRHSDPEYGKLVASRFTKKYVALKMQRLAPNAIMAELYDQTAGNGIVPPMRHVAVQAVLAYVFESCDIFEDRPEQTATA